MRIINYGIELHSLSKKDLELVRVWRNSKHVRQNMQFKKLISSKKQLDWFNALDRKKNLYFIMIHNSTKLGLINLKDIDFKNKIAEAGIFVGNKDYLNTTIPVMATLALMDFAFEVLQLKIIRAKIQAKNEKVISFNKALGYIKEQEQEDRNFFYYSSNKQKFTEATKGIKEFLRKTNPGVTELYFNKNEKFLLSWI